MGSPDYPNDKSNVTNRASSANEPNQASAERLAVSPGFCVVVRSDSRPIEHLRQTMLFLFLIENSESANRNELLIVITCDCIEKLNCSSWISISEVQNFVCMRVT